MSSMTAFTRAQSVLRRILLLLACAALFAGVSSAQTGEEDGPILPRNTDTTPQRRAVTNGQVVRMAKAGLDEQIILQTIQEQPGRYDVEPDDLIALKSAGVSARVISAMQAKTAGLAIHLDEPSKPGKGVVPGPVAPALDEIGVYYKDKTGDWVPLKTERVVFKSSGWVKNALSDGLIKRDMNGHLDGPKSPLILPTGVQILIYAPAGTDAAEYDFLRLETHKDSRDFRTLTGGLFTSESGSGRDELEFHPERIAPQMYTFTVPKDIVKGEYGVLPPGSANQRGLADTGKIFTFSVPE
ncbi:MAG TPA: hypothetical protein VIJ79_14915 [Acidobacteriaceae bacterium]